MEVILVARVNSSWGASLLERQSLAEREEASSQHSSQLLPSGTRAIALSPRVSCAVAAQFFTESQWSDSEAGATGRKGGTAPCGIEKGS